MKVGKYELIYCGETYAYDTLSNNKEKIGGKCWRIICFKIERNSLIKDIESSSDLKYFFENSQGTGCDCCDDANVEIKTCIHFFQKS